MQSFRSNSYDVVDLKRIEPYGWNYTISWFYLVWFANPKISEKEITLHWLSNIVLWGIDVVENWELSIGCWFKKATSVHSDVLITIHFQLTNSLKRKTNVILDCIHFGAFVTIHAQLEPKM